MYKNEPKIEVMYSPDLIGKAPSYWSKSDWNKFHQTMRKAEMTPYTLAGTIWKGLSFCPVFKNGRRLEENFGGADHIAFDFDKAGAALDELFAPGSLADTFGSFGYATPSSTPEAPRSRVVFIVTPTITSAEYYRRLYLAMADHFNDCGSVTDRQCKDPLRLYFGNKNAEMRGIWSILPIEAQVDMIERYEERQRKTKAVRVSLFAPIVADESWQSRKLAQLAENIATAPDGERHHARIVAAYVAGGYIAGGALSENEATAVLVAAARSNTTNPDSAEATILDGIRRGKAAPLYAEDTSHWTGLGGVL